MAQRTSAAQSDHDRAVLAAGRIYRKRGFTVWLNPGGERNQSIQGCYVDVIAQQSPEAEVVWVTEIETETSVSATEAQDQWARYDQAFSRWYLAVPVDSKAEALHLVQRYDLKHCTVITWKRNPEGLHTFWGLPGLGGR